MRLTKVLAAGTVFVIAALTGEAKAQNFNTGNNTAFDPEISIVESGTKLDVQATVSADRKYVTMTMQPQVASLIALREFVFQGPGGTVGMNNPGQVPGPQKPPVRAGTPARTGPLMPALANPRPVGPPPVLLREGMSKVDSVDAPAAAPATQPTSLRSGRR
ncbi:MAG TPA: hypothetical protein VF796_22240 [Humisphaera sp.]